MRRLAPAALLALAACLPEHGPLMAAGQDCLSCHDGNQARLWTVAGTWSGQGQQVAITDASGKALTLTTNQVGNFYTAEPVAFPLQVSVDGARMSPDPTYGGCNRCHGNGGATGPEMLPGRDCLACHVGNGVKLFTVAGTWRSGGIVTLRDARGTVVTLTPNRVGNFFTDAPLQLPLTASVGGETMPQPVTYGGCNQCPGGGGEGGGGG